MRKAILLVGVVAGVAVALLAVSGTGGGTALADNGPHVSSVGDATPDKCAGCHRIHTGQNEYLLKQGGTIAQFCYSCHGDGGPGSDLAVQEGTFYGGTTPGAPYGGKTASTNVGLRAGGFEQARINTTDPSVSNGITDGTIGVLAIPQTVNSWHAIDGTTAGTMWGNGAIGTVGPGPTYTLDCTSCHDPHGNGLYRILRAIPTGSGATTPVNVPDQIAKVYTVTDYKAMVDQTVVGEVPVDLAPMSSWCAQCHTRYLSSADPTDAPPGSGDAIYIYRHRSDGAVDDRACTTCHATHGSNAQMTGPYSSTVPWPGGGLVNPTNDLQRASLLKMDNRGICGKCHGNK